MRKFLSFFVCLLLILLLMTFVVHAAARQQDAPQALQILLPDDTCPAPCWIGVNTDETEHAATVDAIMSLPGAAQEGIIEWTFGSDARQTVRLERGRDIEIRTAGVRLGQVMAVLGLPDYQIRGNIFDARRSVSGEYVRFYFADEHMMVTVNASDTNRISPQTPVIQIAYPAGPFPQPSDSHLWQGYLHMPAYSAPGFGEFILME
jgi:hypothetical protein